MQRESIIRSLEENKAYFSGFAHSFKIDGTTGDDILQDSILKALSSRTQYSEDNKFKSWFCTIIRNTAMDHIKALKRSRELFSNIPLASAEMQEAKSFQLASISNSIQSKADLLTEADILRNASQFFTEREMTIIKQLTQGMAQEDIANNVSLSYRYIRRLIYDMRKRANRNRKFILKVS